MTTTAGGGGNNNNGGNNGDWFRMYLMDLRERVEGASVDAKSAKEASQDTKVATAQEIAKLSSKFSASIGEMNIRIQKLEELAGQIRKFQWAIFTALVLGAIGVLFQAFEFYANSGIKGP